MKRQPELPLQAGSVLGEVLGEVLEEVQVDLVEHEVEAVSSEVEGGHDVSHKIH